MPGLNSTNLVSSTDSRKRSEKSFDLLELVWAHQKGYPWWPAVICHSPVEPGREKYWILTNSTEDLPKYKYHCVFLAWDSDRAWLPEKEYRKLKREDLLSPLGAYYHQLTASRDIMRRLKNAISLALMILDNLDASPLDYLEIKKKSWSVESYTKTASLETFEPSFATSDISKAEKVAMPGGIPTNSASSIDSCKRTQKSDYKKSVSQTQEEVKSSKVKIIDADSTDSENESRLVFRFDSVIEEGVL